MLLIVILENIVKGVGNVFSVPPENIVLMRVALIAQIVLLEDIQLRVLLLRNVSCGKTVFRNKTKTLYIYIVLYINILYTYFN